MTDPTISSAAGGGQHNWEEATNSWEKAVQEDEEGRIIVSSGNSIADIIRLRRKRLKQNDYALREKKVVRDMIRYLFVIIDCSRWVKSKDPVLPGGSMLEVAVQILLEFVDEFYDQNPLSHLGFVILKNGEAEVLTKLSSSSKAHKLALQSLANSPSFPSGELSLQNGLETAGRSLGHQPRHGSREILVVCGALSTCDPGHILTETMPRLKAANIRVSTFALFAELHICRKLAEETLQRANELLEEEVENRTRDLIEMNKDLVRQVQVREQAEHAEREQRKFSEALSDATAVLTESLQLSDVLDRILSFAGRVVPPHDAASIILVEDEVYIRHLRFRRYVNGEAVDILADKDSYYLDSLPILRRIHDSRTPVVIQDVDGDVDWLDVDEIRWVKSYICVPIQTQGRVIGFLTVASRKAGQFASAHANRLLTFSNQAGIAIQNAQLFSEVNRSASELRRRVADATIELESERAQLRAILDAMTEGVLYTDRRNRTRYINTSMTRLTGYTSEEWVKNQQNIWKLMLADDTDVDQFIRQIQDKILRHGLWQGEVRLRRKEGDIFDASLVVTRVMRGEGELGGAVTVLRDIRAEKQLEAQKTRFIATASHELRTPITNIKTRLYLLQKRPDTLDKHMPVLTSVTERMRKLVDDLLDVSRFEHGVITLRRTPVELQTIVRDIVDTQIPEADKRLLKLIYHAPSEPLTVLVDVERIAQVITNLLTNAINYTPEGGKITIELRESHDEMNNPFVDLDVRDTGIGIPKHLLGDIFKPFFRVSDYNTGTGLGLSITKEIIELHGGTIGVESEEAQGTCFTVRLPLMMQSVQHAHELQAEN